MQSIEEEFTQILIFMGIQKESIRKEASLLIDYDFDESRFILLALYIGIFFRINVKESEYAEFDTVGGTINFVKKKLRNV